jgi:MFS family permease
MNKKTIFYGWWIVVSCVIILAFMWALPMSCFSIFITPITTEMGFSVGAFGLCSTIVSIVGMLFSPFIGRWMEKYNVKIVMGISVLAVALGFTGYSLSQNLAVFYVSAVLIGAGLNGASIMAVSIIMKNWFIEKRGLATSIALAGSGLGGTIFSILINKLILSIGWRHTYQILALLIVLIVIPIVIFVIQKKPEDRGLLPLGYENANKNSTGEGVGLNYTLNQLKGKPILWIYAISAMFIGFAVGGVLLQANTYLQAIGNSSTVAAGVVSAFLLIAIPGKIILGYVYDKNGSVAGALLGCGTFIISAICLLLSGSMAFLVLFTIFYGFGTCNGTVTPSVLTSRIFGAKHYGEIYGLVNVFAQLGVAFANPILGTIYDVTKSYQISWIICIVLGILALFGLLYCIKEGKREEANSTLVHQTAV